MYHPTAGHWVLVSLIETLVGEPYGDAIHRMVTEPLDLPRLLGIPVTEQEGSSRSSPSASRQRPTTWRRRDCRQS